MIVPITFEHEDKLYSGHFNSVSGAGSGMWHLMIDNYYKGELHYSGHSGQWLFTSNSGLFDELSDYFKAYLIGWFG